MPDYLEEVLERCPCMQPLGVVNPSERILLMIDEAHRTQSGDLGDNLFEAFPNATRLAFTGTPLIVVKDRKTTDRAVRAVHRQVQAPGCRGRRGHGPDSLRGQDRRYRRQGQGTSSTPRWTSLARKHVASQMRKAENVSILQEDRRASRTGCSMIW